MEGTNANAGQKQEATGRSRTTTRSCIARAARECELPQPSLADRTRPLEKLALPLYLTILTRGASLIPTPTLFPYTGTL